MIGSTGIWSAAEAKPEHFPVSPKLARNLDIILAKHKLVIDFGCGNGFYLKALKQSGFDMLIGIDGYNSTKSDFIFEADLSKPRNFAFRGQVISLEVGEHIPVKYEQIFLDNVCRHCESRLIISWAVIGQNGIGHVNCRSNDYIINCIAERGFTFNKEVTQFLRNDIENHVSYFRNTLMVFDKNL
jgi:hypothetical protein